MNCYAIFKMRHSFQASGYYSPISMTQEIIWHWTATGITTFTNGWLQGLWSDVVLYHRYSKHLSKQILEKVSRLLWWHIWLWLYNKQE